MIKREISSKIKSLSKKYPIIALIGPRQSGKSTLAKNLFSKYEYVNLESPQLRDFAENDPESFFERYSGRVILDEIQNVPRLFSYLQVIVDEKKQMGDFIITGSSQFKLYEQISQSLAGRVSIFKLLPLSIKELKKEKYFNSVSNSIVTGFYPAIYDRKIEPIDYYADYISTYLEKDVRSLINVKDLRLFQTFLKLCAGRVGSTLNYTSIANDVGVSRETIKSWLSVLEASFITFQLSPYFQNINKRVVKSQKLYFYDTGLLCHLLGVNSEQAYSLYPLKGGIFENYVISEMLKQNFNQHKEPDFYFYKDSSGLEIDLLYIKDGKQVGVEIKSSKTFSSNFIKNIKKWKTLINDKLHSGHVVYAGDINQNRGDIQILSVNSLNKLP